MVEVQFRVCEIYLLTYINNVLSGKKPILFTVEEALLLLTQCIVQLVLRCEMSHSYFRIDHKKYNYVKQAPKKDDWFNRNLSRWIDNLQVVYGLVKP